MSIHLNPYEIYHPNWDEWRYVDARSEESAITDMAERYDMRGDYSISSGQEEYFAIRQRDRSEIHFYRAEGRLEPYYSSHKVEKDKISDRNFKRDFDDFLKRLRGEDALPKEALSDDTN